MEVWHYYQVALLAIVVPSILINRVAASVVLAWAAGQIVHDWWPAYEDAADMFAYIVALGGALALCRPLQDTWRSTARLTTALSFVPLATLAGLSAALQPTDGVLYWPWAGLLWLQIVLVMLGNDWFRLWSTCLRLDGWLIARLARHFGEQR